MLAKATQNQTYLNSGSNSKDFYYNQLRNPEGVLLDGIWADSCASGNLTFPTNAVGAMIEGLATLLSLIKYPALRSLEEIVDKAVSKVDWYDTEGILLVDDAQANAQLVAQYVVRGLSTIYIRNISQPALRPYIQEYLAVQYNAVLGNARGSGVNNNIYGGSWAREQPATSDFSFEQQTNALSILVAAISIRNDANPPGGEPSKPFPGPHTARPGAAVIAGVAVAVTVVLCSAGLATWLICRRNLRRTGSIGLGLTQSRIDPYTISTSEHLRCKPKSGGHKEGKWLPDGITSQFEGTPENQLTDGDATSNVVQREVRESDNSIPTADLVRVLNQRLRAGREWRQDEPPPDYFSEEAPAGHNGSTTEQKRAIVM
ncbi:hypothetical protein AAF712_000913 [Marasmius tenuissimus]|uniref:Receptor ligand binding region domain-containing protein n=1 Tax=Marasmius tenuissimus TaxID=585030 RepID=A0ABR3AEM3_9AGAR